MNSETWREAGTHPFSADKTETLDGLDNPDVSNGDRADWAISAVEAFKKRCGQRNEGIADENVTDLLCDLMHLCDALELPFEEALMSASNHYENER